MSNHNSDATLTPLVQTEQGVVQGYFDDRIYCFKGLPYGADTAGENRFRPPQPPPAWEGVREATRFGADAPQQNPDRRAARQEDAAVQTSGVEGENCLVLNVWTPGLEPSERKPVMVWLHGGGFVSGSGSGTIYNGRNLADRGDLVLVSINHRLGVLGYLNLDGVVESEEPLVNLGMLDILGALEWVQRNIERFGGDPDQVTIFGESGGGRKVTSLLAMPSAQHLFHRGIIQSGPAVFMNDADASQEITAMFLKALGMDKPTLRELQQLPLDDLLRAQHAAVREAGRSRPGIAQTLAAVVDGEILPHHPFDPDAPAISDDKPVIVGYNQTEATLFMGRDEGLWNLDEDGLLERVERLVGEKAAAIIDQYREAYPDATCSDLLAFITTGNSRYPVDSITLAERKAARGAAPVWLYTLTFRSTARRGALRTPHALEIPFVFDGVEGSRAFVGEGDGPDQMAEQMSSTWIAFARNGDPNNGTIPRWEPYDGAKRSTMVFNTESRLVEDFGKVEREAFGRYFYGSD